MKVNYIFFDYYCEKKGSFVGGHDNTKWQIISIAESISNRVLLQLHSYSCNIILNQVRRFKQVFRNLIGTLSKKANCKHTVLANNRNCFLYKVSDWKKQLIVGKTKSMIFQINLEAVEMLETILWNVESNGKFETFKMWMLFAKSFVFRKQTFKHSSLMVEGLFGWFSSNVFQSHIENVRVAGLIVVATT